MTRHFCTFFDKNYLGRGLALYYSLLRHCPDFTLWILCTDSDSYDMLKRMDLPGIKLLKMSEVEDSGMLAVKPQRSHIEYTWMFSSQLPLYLFEKQNLDMVTYLDADLLFYSNLDEIYREMGDNSILIIPHRYSPQNLEREKTSGIYNVGLLVFKNDNRALQCLKWWKERCIEWCFARYENGKHGDQMYLNDWPRRFGGVCVLENAGANVAPWNIANYKLRRREGQISGMEKQSKKYFNLIFYHFHGFKFFITAGGKIRPYPITIYSRSIYQRYIESLRKAYDKIRSVDSAWDFGCASKLGLTRLIKQYATIWLTRQR